MKGGEGKRQWIKGRARLDGDIGSGIPGDDKIKVATPTTKVGEIPNFVVESDKWGEQGGTREREKLLVAWAPYMYQS